MSALPNAAVANLRDALAAMQERHQALHAAVDADRRRLLHAVCDAAILARRLRDDDLSLDAGSGDEARRVRVVEPSGGTGFDANTDGRHGSRTDLRQPGRPFANTASRADSSPSSSARLAAHPGDAA